MTTIPKPRTPIWLLSLFFAAFAIGTDDFVIAGILPRIAEDLKVPTPVAGQLVTAFSVTYAVAAPIAAVVTARWSRRTVMLVATSLFVAGNLLAALAPSFSTLLGLRVLLAIAGATITPAAVATAAALAPPGRQGRYIGTVAAGLTVALAAGVPIGTLLGDWFGWRSTMVFVALLAAAAVIGMLTLSTSDNVERVPLNVRLAPLRRPAILTGLLSLLVAAAGGLMFYEYIAPVAEAVSAAGPKTLALLIAIAGVGGALGTWLGGRATDRFGPERTTLVAVSCQAAAVLLVAVLGTVLPAGSLPVPVLGALLTGWALAGWAFNPAMHMRFIGLAGNAGAEVIGLSTSAMFFGISIAGGLGGAVLAGFGAAAVPVASGVLSLVGLAGFAITFLVFPAGGRDSRVTVAADRA